MKLAGLESILPLILAAAILGAATSPPANADESQPAASVGAVESQRATSAGDDKSQTAASDQDSNGGAPSDSAPTDEAPVYKLAPLVITATRTPRPLFLTPNPASVIKRGTPGLSLESSWSEMFSEVAGLDMNGAGSNQRRPTIRGHRGQRILLLEDGTRLNNSRRQQDFGEIPALVDPASVERVEIVRGAGSVLYGSDAIGGVVNVITREPSRDGWHGGFGYRYATEGVQNSGSASVEGRGETWTLVAAGTARNAGSLVAPGGSYGDITLENDKVVRDTGIQDESFSIRGSSIVADQVSASLKFERYHADTAGFGYVDPADFDPNSPFIRILYPDQTFHKTTLGVSAYGMESILADRVNATTYYQENDRGFNLDIRIPIGPGAQVATNTFNRTNLQTFGGRVELAKRVNASHLFTYGFDAFRDLSENADSSATVVTGFGPPMVETSNIPLVPNATYRSMGAFVQDEWGVTERWTLIAGARAQDVLAKTRGTTNLEAPKFEAQDATVVGSANSIYRLTDDLAAVASVGRAFRSPNLVERFFHGPTPEGQGFQVRNLDLAPETSLDVNMGLRWRNSRASLEGFVFRTKITDGIRIAATGDTLNGLPGYQNVNIDELVHEGAEVEGELQIVSGLRAGGNWSRLDAENKSDGTPIGEGYKSRIAAWAGWRDARERWWMKYHIRYVGERDDLELGTNPVGETLPSFTVHSASAGAKLGRFFGTEQTVSVAVENLTDELYAEFSNVSFFRPEPRRSVIVAFESRF